MSDYKVRGRIWVAKENEVPFLGPGRISLLQKIEDLGSIRAAAKALGMSYRRAWRLVESLNRESPVLLVSTTVGGAGGGGARLTPAGKAILEMFEDLEAHFQEFLEQETEKIRKKFENLK
ncbi:MAG TPA: LysR family transcriptional regulator [Thermodesulfobacteriaceae bacterium]|nr:LysR family transcriptional regulator [Thermodesulfobacteriaceae bacterium]